MGRRGLLIPAVVVFSCVTVMGCASGNFAYETAQQEAETTWRSSNAAGVELTLRDDETFVAARWPEALICDNDAYRTADEIDSSPRVDADGVWVFNPGAQPGSAPSISLSFDDIRCPGDGPLTYLWRSEPGQLSFCIPLRGVDADALQPDRILILLPQDAGASAADDACA